MSRCCRRKEMPVTICNKPDNCICNFPTLIILILIILQFAKRSKRYDDCEDDYDRDDYDRDYDEKDYGHKTVVDNGVLFIIALFFLSCAGCGKR